MLATSTFLAHPLTEPGGLPFPPLWVGLAAAVVVAAAAWALPGPGPRGDAPDPARTFSWAGGLSTPQVGARALAVALLALAVVAGRLGSPQELQNLAPALVIGVAWPLLLLGSAILGPIWRWLDPWDAAARPLAGPGEAGAARDVRWAVIPALAWTWYLSAFPRPLDPRTVGAALGVYALAMVAGSLAVGRVAWLSRVEVFGLLFGWVGMLRRGLVRWRPPRGAEVVLGALGGGLIFGSIRLSEVWGGLNVIPGALVWATVGLLGSAALLAAALVGLGRWAELREAPGSVAAAMVPAVMGVALALSMARNRLTTSVQLLPGLLVDPLGTRGGPRARGWPLEPDPLGSLGLVLAQVGVLVAAHLVAAVVIARRTGRWGRVPAAAAISLTVFAGIVGVTAVPPA